MAAVSVDHRDFGRHPMRLQLAKSGSSVDTRITQGLHASGQCRIDFRITQESPLSGDPPRHGLVIQASGLLPPNGGPVNSPLEVGNEMRAVRPDLVRQLGFIVVRHLEASRLDLQVEFDGFPDPLRKLIQRPGLRVTTRQLGHGGNVIAFRIVLDDDIQGRKPVPPTPRVALTVGSSRCRERCECRRASNSVTMPARVRPNAPIMAAFSCMPNDVRLRVRRVDATAPAQANDSPSVTSFAHPSGSARRGRNDAATEPLAADGEIMANQAPRPISSSNSG